MLPVRDRQDYQVHQLSIREGHRQALRSQVAQATFLKMQQMLPGSCLSLYGSPTEVALSLEKGGPDVRDALTVALTELVRHANAISSLAVDLLCLGYWHDLCDLQAGSQVDGPGELCSEVYVVFLERIRDADVRYGGSQQLMDDVGVKLASKARHRRRKPRPATCDDDDLASAGNERRRALISTDIVPEIPRLQEDLEEIFGKADGQFFFKAHLMGRAVLAAQMKKSPQAVSSKLSRMRTALNEHLARHNKGIILFEDNSEDAE